MPSADSFVHRGLKIAFLEARRLAWVRFPVPALAREAIVSTNRLLIYTTIEEGSATVSSMMLFGSRWYINWWLLVRAATFPLTGESSFLLGCSSLDRRVKLPTYWSGSCASFGSGLWRLIQQFSHICVTRKMSGQCAIRSSWRYSRTPRVYIIIRCILRTGSTSRGLCGTKTPTRTINSDGHTSYFIYCAYQ